MRVFYPPDRGHSRPGVRARDDHGVAVRKLRGNHHTGRHCPMIRVAMAARPGRPEPATVTSRRGSAWACHSSWHWHRDCRLGNCLAVTSHGRRRRAATAVSSAPGVLSDRDSGRARPGRVRIRPGRDRDSAAESRQRIRKAPTAAAGSPGSESVAPAVTVSTVT
jgi:hypothetical protein